MKKFFSVLSLTLITMWVAQVQAADQINQKDPYAMVRQVASSTFDRMKTEKEAIKLDGEQLRKIVEQELLPYVDHQYSALMVLGTHARSVPRDKLIEFIETFRTYLVTTYAAALGYYTDQTVQFEPAKSVQGKSKLTIKALIQEQGRQDIEVAFKVRFTKEEEWKAYDMIAEGVSMLDSKRSEFASVIRQQGVDEAIRLMKEKSSQPIEMQSDKT